MNDKERDVCFTNLLSKEGMKCVGAALASLCHPPVACRSPDHLIKSCQRRKWSHGAETDGTASRKRNKRPDATTTKKKRMEKKTQRR